MQKGEVRIINGKLSLITGGNYYGDRGVSNHWTWRTIRKDGTLGKEYGGYNNGSNKFSKPISHKVIIKVNTFDLLKSEL